MGRFQYVGSAPGVRHGFPTWQPGEVRDVDDEAEAAELLQSSLHVPTESPVGGGLPADPEPDAQLAAEQAASQTQDTGGAVVTDQVQLDQPPAPELPPANPDGDANGGTYNNDPTAGAE